MRWWLGLGVGVVAGGIASVLPRHADYGFLLIALTWLVLPLWYARKLGANAAWVALGTVGGATTYFIFLGLSNYLAFWHPLLLWSLMALAAITAGWRLKHKPEALDAWRQLVFPVGLMIALTALILGAGAAVESYQEELAHRGVPCDTSVCPGGEWGAYLVLVPLVGFVIVAGPQTILSGVIVSSLVERRGLAQQG